MNKTKKAGKRKIHKKQKKENVIKSGKQKMEKLKNKTK